MNKLLILLVGLCLVAAARSDEDKERREKIRELNEQLTGWKQEDYRAHLEPEETFDKLRQLADLYIQDGVSEDDDRLQDIRKAQSIEGINDERCKEREPGFIKIVFSVVYTNKVGVSLRVPLEKHARKQLEHCSNLIKQRLDEMDKSMVDKMSKLGRIFIKADKRMWKKCAENSKNGRSFPRDPLPEELLKFLKQQSNKWKQPKSKENFDQIFEEHLGGFCKKFTSQLDYLVFVRHNKDPELFNAQVDDTVWNVSQGLLVCFNMVNLRYETYQLYLLSDNPVARLARKVAEKNGDWRKTAEKVKAQHRGDPEYVLL